MKTFRFTVPEFPLSKVERRPPLSERSVEAPFLTADGTITDEGIDYLKRFKELRLDQLRSYILYYAKKTMISGLTSALGFFLLLGTVVSLLAWDASALIKLGKQVPLYWLAYVATSSLYLRKSWRAEADLFDRLQAAKRIEETEQAAPPGV